MSELNFIDYLVGIAPVGETILLVKQKPLLDKGALQYHNDGAIKCTWPAYLPEQAKIKKGDAWYANTACFIVDRFADGKVSASASNCERVAFMVLDDVGTKSKVPPLAPTWIIETSPANYQYGYTFALDDQPLKGDFSAAIKAIADAGFTDGGAINPVRNFRVAGSVNLKPNRDNFASKLIELHPKREFSLPQICEALAVTPAPADTASITSIRLKDDGGDDVLSWMSANGMIITPTNGEGWIGVVCPNSASHSDGNPEARYKPLDRSFCCYHEHCQDLDSKTFLSWVADNGGPKHTHGLREELLADVMTTALSKIEPSDMFTHDADDLIAEVERKELGRIEKADWFKRFAYIQEDDAYFDLIERREISRSTFNALFRHIDCRSIHTAARVLPAVSYDENRQTMGAKALVGITYAAGETVLVSRDGDIYGNRWRDARPTNLVEGDIAPWLDHARSLVPNEDELAHILDVMAFKVQHPEIKINHAVLHGGDEGSGKDTFWAPFLWAVCGDNLRNRGIMDNDSVNSQWGYQLESEVLIINELKEPDASARRQLANKLKPIIAAPPEMLPINRKGLHPYMMLNRVFVLAFSNDPVPISLASQDRRWFCVWSHAPRMEPSAAAKLWQWYKAGGFSAIANWLMLRDTSKFNPSAAPMMTEFKANLVEHGMSMAESYLVEQMRGRIGEFSKGVIGSPFHSLCDRLAGSAPSGVKIPQAALLHALKEAGWIDRGRLASTEYMNKKHIYCAPELDSYKKSELRRMVEISEPPKMVVIK